MEEGKKEEGKEEGWEELKKGEKYKGGNKRKKLGFCNFSLYMYILC